MAFSSIWAGWLNAQSSHLNQHKTETWRRETESSSRAYPEVVLICQPAHINTRKSTHLHNLGGKPELQRCSWVQAHEILGCSQIPIYHIPSKCTLIVFIFKCLKSTITNVCCQVVGSFQKQSRMIMAYSKLLLVPCALSRIPEGSGLKRRKITHVWFKIYSTENRIALSYWNI